MRSPSEDGANATTPLRKLPQVPVISAPIQACGTDPKSGRVAPVFCMAVANGAGSAAAVLAIEKFDQFGDHLVRRLFHQPVAPAFDEHALDVISHHLALLDQERTAGFLA